MGLSYNTTDDFEGLVSKKSSQLRKIQPPQSRTVNLDVDHRHNNHIVALNIIKHYVAL